LGFFETVKVSPSDGAQPDRADLKVEVKEKATGEISFGAGFSSTDGPLGDFSIRERNFLGKGQDVRIGATVSGVTKQFDLSFTEPYFLDRDLSAGVDVFHVIRDNQDQSSYDEKNTGSTLRLGYPLSEEMRQRINYTLQENSISNVPSGASRFVREQEGSSIKSVIGQELSYDTRDSRLEPTTGFVTRLSTDFAGLGGDVHFLRARISGTQYYEIYEKYVLSGTVEAGYIWGIDEDVRINDRFFLGGENLRGFEFAGLGPRDLTGGADDALGGNRFTRGSIELSFPTPLPDDLGFKGHAFTDFGTLGDNDENPLTGEVFKHDESLRLSVGAGMSWQSPFGPIRLDLAQAILRKRYDNTQFVHFSFGTRF
jgi:outer membrane protein insertion porin family